MMGASAGSTCEKLSGVGSCLSSFAVMCACCEKLLAAGVCPGLMSPSVSSAWMTGEPKPFHRQEVLRRLVRSDGLRLIQPSPATRAVQSN